MVDFLKKNNFRDTITKIIFLLLPTLLVVFFLLWNANQYYTVVLKNEALSQTFYVGLGMLSGALIYHFRFRFLPLFLLLIFVLWLIYKGLDAVSIGEFDTFFVTVQFLIFAITFTFGWVLAWAFIRWRFASIIVSGLFLLGCIVLLSRQNSLFFALGKSNGLKDYIRLFAPVLVYSIYIIFTSELIYSYRNYKGSIWWPFGKRLIGFATLILLLLGGVFFLQKENIEETMAKVGGGGQKGDNSMLHKNKDNTFDLNDYSKLSGSLGRDNQLLFAAHIDHYFDAQGGQFPSPIYLTAFYYSKFDTATQTFERDPNIPRNDLFVPDPSKIPLFSTKTDSSVLTDALKDKFRNTVDIEVYKTELSASSFVAPSLAYWVQPITVEKDFKDKFKSAYRAKSYISELNSAYFVYNAENPIIEQFQQQRFQTLRSVKDFNSVPKDMMKYYTFMPNGSAFNSIRLLADSIQKGKDLPIDKILAIRDFFLARDENGKKIFAYSDNPGIPDIPNASLLKYFLFQSKKGYCAYYAGATLFMLRAMGIPSRIAVGFMTVDRSNGQNPGWYWYYADQAHAWVQVLFPGYGWLDFDTTIGNDDARESPQPDGTPPMQPPKAYFATKGSVEEVDTIQKTVRIKINKFVFHDKDYSLSDTAVVIGLDLASAQILRDSLPIALADVQMGDSATAVSYAQSLKNLKFNQNEGGDQILKKIPEWAPIDELHVQPKVITQPDKKGKQQIAKTSHLHQILWTGVGLLLFLILLIFALPYLIYQYFKMKHQRSKNLKDNAYWSYRTAAYYLYLQNEERGALTYKEFAGLIDQKYKTHFFEFMVPYLKLKYGNQMVNNEETASLKTFLSPFLSQMKSQIPVKKQVISFLRPLRALGFFISKI